VQIDDEVVEVTPKSVRMRKKELDPSKRKAKGRKAWDDFVFEDESLK
jgi:GTP-binding protein